MVDFYPDVFLINNVEMKGQRHKETVLIPYTDQPDVGNDDIIIQKQGTREVQFKVIDCSFRKFPHKSMGTKHTHFLQLSIKNINTETTTQSAAHFNIGTINSSQVQIGNQNTQITNITIQEIIEKVAKTDDNEAKSLLKKILENPTVAAVLGSATGSLIGLL